VPNEEPDVPATTVASPPVTTVFRPGEQPRVVSLTHSPDDASTETDVTIVATATNRSGQPYTLVISMQGKTGDWFDVKTCSASPCEYTSRFGAGEWKYRATATDDLGRVAMLEPADAHFVVANSSKK
jgi:hypothetical protein